MNLKFFFLYCFLGSVVSVRAQEKSFNHYGLDQGLSQSVILSICQDSKGFLWVGTQDGLNRFDGYSFEKFKNNPLDPSSLSNNWVYSVAEDSMGYIWVGTKSGLSRFNPRKKLFTNFLYNETDSNSLAGSNVNGVLVGRDGRIYANTPLSLSCYDPVSSKFERYFHGFGSTTGVEDNQFPLCQELNGNIWIPTSNGLACFNPSTGTFQNTEKLNDLLPHRYVSTLFIDKRGVIWIGTRAGLAQYNPFFKSFKVFNYEQDPSKRVYSGFVRSITVDKSGVAWIGTDAFGLYRIENKRDKEYITHYTNNAVDPTSINSDGILSLLVDRSNILWIGTLNGLDHFDLKPMKFKLYRKSSLPSSVNLLQNVIASVFKDDKGLIWVGNWGKGLNLVNRETGQVSHYSTLQKAPYYIPNDYVHVIFKDSEKNMWIGTRNGLLVFNRKTNAFVSYKQFFQKPDFPDFSENRIYHIKQLANKSIWIATQNGLYCFEPGMTAFKVFYRGNGPYDISDNLIYALAEDVNSNLWVGTANGLDFYCKIQKKFTHYKRDPDKNNTLCDNYIVSLAADSKGRIWIGTKSGVNCYNLELKNFKFFSNKDGLTSNVVYEIVEDKNQGMWFSTGRGLFKFIPETNRFKSYGIEDGLQSLEFNLRASYCSEDGEMFFGGMNGLNSFYPDSLFENPYQPEIAITRIEKENDSGRSEVIVPMEQKIVFDHSDYTFDLYFSALEYTNPSKNQYKYKLEGASEKWIELGNRRFISFSNLQHGRYTLHILGTNNDGLWSSKPELLQILITPPWWQSTVAYIVYFLISVISIFLIIKFREKRLRKEKEILENKVQERTTEIMAQKLKIEKAYSDIQNLSTIGQKISSSLIVSKIISTVYENINNLLDVNIFGIGVRKEESNCLFFTHAVEDGNILDDFSISFLEENMLAIRCLNGEEIVTGSSEELLKAGTRVSQLKTVPESVVFIPLVSGNKTIGIISVQSYEKDAYKPYHVNLLKSVAVYVSIALENAGAYTKIEAQKNDIESKNKILQQQKEEILSQQEEIKAQRDIATEQRDEISKQKKSITDSIHYAKRIQSALLPKNEIFNNHFSGIFELYKPRDIVSGDFYWFEQTENWVIVSAVDCTGHGVPGAMMSMLGISFLNEIVNSTEIYEPHKILEKLRELIKHSLQQTGKEDEQKDGMDMSICAINTVTQQLFYAGANCPVYICRDNHSQKAFDLIEFKPDFQPVGIYPKERAFSLHTFQLQANDMLYLFSDGYISQFGGSRRETLKTYRFKAYLKSIAGAELSAQKSFLESKLAEWQGDIEQIDDILVLGIRI